MQRKDHIDLFGAVSLVAVSLILGLNQVVIKVVNDGVQPVFAAGLRSAGAMVLIYLWMVYRGVRLEFLPGTVWAGLFCGSLFAFEFMMIFLALDFTSVARTSVIFYSMPVWLAIMAQLLLPDEKISARKALGLALSLAGVAVAMADRPAGGAGSLGGDLMALLAAICWAAIALTTRITRFSQLGPEMQMFWQVTVSAPLLLCAAWFFGPFIRDFAPIHVAGLAFQTVLVVFATFLFWFWLLKRYPASGVASFSFLAPVFGVGFGWVLLGEDVGFTLLFALALVAVGLVLTNKPAR